MTGDLESGSAILKFLIVDDHAGFRRALRAFLPPGAVVECSDGSNVLACYAAHRPDWVLMDIAMPGLDGFAATREIKAQFPQARVIFISNYSEEEFRQKAQEVGAYAFVHKDDLEDLRRIITSPDL